MVDLSPSTLNIFKDCPRCFWLQFRKGIRRPATPFPSLPSGMDRIIKVHFDRARQRGELPPELSGLRGFRLFDKMQFLRKWRDGYGVSWRDEHGNTIRGKVDDLLVHDGKLVMLDYKTRGSEPHENSHTYYLDQLSIYGWLFEKNGFFVEDFGFLLFYYPDFVEEMGEFHFHSHLRKVKVDTGSAERLIGRALELLEGDIPEPSPRCEFCRWEREVHKFF